MSQFQHDGTFLVLLESGKYRFLNTFREQTKTSFVQNIVASIHVCKTYILTDFFYSNSCRLNNKMVNAMKSFY